MMNVINKLLTFGHVQLVDRITDDTPENINFMYGFILWIVLPLIALIPAFLVEEDLRRLNMKDVQQSQYFEEKAILALNDEQRQQFIRDNRIIAEQDVLDHYALIYKRLSVPVVRQSEALIDDEQSRRITNRLSDQSVKSNSNMLTGGGKIKESLKDRSDMSRKSKATENLSKKMDQVSLGLSKKVSVSSQNQKKQTLGGGRRKNRKNDDDSDDSMTF